MAVTQLCSEPSGKHLRAHLGLYSHVGSSPSRKVAGYSSPIVALRKELDLYANIRPVAAVRSQQAVRLNNEGHFPPSGSFRARGKTSGRLDRSAGKHRVLGAHYTKAIVDHLRVYVQYVKQETLTLTDSGKEARATRLITERASRRIGTMAFELALARPRKVLVTPLFTIVITLHL